MADNSESAEEGALNTVFTLEWCGCVFEEGYVTASLHSTKRGAFKAMVAAAAVSD